MAETDWLSIIMCPSTDNVQIHIHRPQRYVMTASSFTNEAGSVSLRLDVASENQQLLSRRKPKDVIHVVDIPLHELRETVQTLVVGGTLHESSVNHTVTNSVVADREPDQYIDTSWSQPINISDRTDSGSVLVRHTVASEVVSNVHTDELVVEADSSLSSLTVKVEEACETRAVDFPGNDDSRASDSGIESSGPDVACENHQVFSRRRPKDVIHIVDITLHALRERWEMLTAMLDEHVSSYTVTRLEISEDRRPGDGETGVDRLDTSEDRPPGGEETGVERLDISVDRRHGDDEIGVDRVDISVDRRPGDDETGVDRLDTSEDRRPGNDIIGLDRVDISVDRRPSDEETVVDRLDTSQDRRPGEEETGVERLDISVDRRPGDEETGVDRLDASMDRRPGDEETGVDRLDTSQDRRPGGEETGVERLDISVDRRPGDDVTGVDRLDTSEDRRPGEEETGVERLDISVDRRPGDEETGMDRLDTNADIRPDDDTHLEKLEDGKSENAAAGQVESVDSEYSEVEVTQRHPLVEVSVYIVFVVCCVYGCLCTEYQARGFTYQVTASSSLSYICVFFTFFTLSFAYVCVYLLGDRTYIVFQYPVNVIYTQNKNILLYL